MKLISFHSNASDAYKSISRIFLLIILPVIITEAQSIQPRSDFGALLEPQGKIINGAGQDLASYQNYWSVMNAQDKPLIYMYYLGLKNATSDWADGLKTILMSHEGKFQIPQIGLSMAEDGTPGLHYEQDVAAGLYDDQITMFIDGLQSLAIPAFVRIGYEFNGTGWNGYQPSTYKQAFTHITNMIRARGVEVATVWDLAMDGAMNYMDYYPGDEYVDWWAINIFSANHFTDPNAQNFMQSATVHHKPVMFGETTPRYVGVLNGQQSWDDWFAPFFTFIHSHPGLKAISYINWDWSQYPQWSTWGDARLEMNSIVSNSFAGEMDSMAYLHASPESVFRKTFGIPDNTAPATPGSISVVEPGYPLTLTWSAVTDPSLLSHYTIYKHGKLSDYTLSLPYPDKNIAAGDTITYSVSAMDRAGNESTKTADLKVTVPSALSKALNGEFDEGTLNWTLSTYASGASATMNVDNSSLISGPNSCKVNVMQVTGTNWHIQLWQWAQIYQGRKYKITFKAKASSSVIINVGLQLAASPYTVYLDKNHTLTTDIQTFTDTITSNANVQAQLKFMLGSKANVQIWIDEVTLTETFAGPDGINEQENHNLLLRNFPNPFINSTQIIYQVKEQGDVSLKIFDVMGKQVATLVNDQKSEGEYSVEWNASGLAGGIYFCRLQTSSLSETTKLIFQK